MNCSRPGFPVLHYLPEFTQTHIHWVSDAIQPSHPVPAPFSSWPQSVPASESFPLSWLFSSGDQSIGASTSASVLPVDVQGWFPSGLSGLSSLRAFSIHAQWLWLSGLVAPPYVGSSQTRCLGTGVPCISRQILNDWTTREVPNSFF